MTRGNVIKGLECCLRDTNEFGDCTVSKLFAQYMEKVSHAVMRHCVPEDGLYHGVEGCHRLARECGAAFLDFEVAGLDAEKLIGRTYSGICVIAYGLKPPVDAGQWMGWVREGLNDARKREELRKSEEAEVKEGEGACQ